MQKSKGYNQKWENTGKENNLIGKDKYTIITVTQPLKS